LHFRVVEGAEEFSRVQFLASYYRKVCEDKLTGPILRSDFELFLAVTEGSVAHMPNGRSPCSVNRKALAGYFSFSRFAVQVAISQPFFAPTQYSGRLKPCKLAGIDQELLMREANVFENRETRSGRTID